MSLIFLVGMPAAGKSFWGKKIATKCKINFIDLDTYIEQQQQMTVPVIFSTYGEDKFRQIEHSCLLEIMTKKRTETIIACGGGTPCFFNNMELMKKAGTVIYLEADLNLLVTNIKKSIARPLMKNSTNFVQFMEEQYKSRKGCYEQAHIFVPVKTLTIANFEKIINKCIGKL